MDRSLEILPLALATDPARCGGKAVQLGAATRASLPVPSGAVVTAHTSAAIAAGDEGAITSLRHYYETAVNGPIAIRSSGVGEDSRDTSFAGQHETYLNVQNFEDLVASVASVWRSARSEAALAYRRQHDIAGDPACAVVLQELIEPDVAGVMFTIDPITGADRRVIEAAWGFGEAVVSGLVTPDHIHLDPAGNVLELRLGSKKQALRSRSAGGLETYDVLERRLIECCLDETHFSRLNELAVQVERAFGLAQDIEWAFTGAALFLLQVRPVTARTATPS